MENLTPKEIAIVKVLVRLHSFSDLRDELDSIITESYHVSKYVNEAQKLLGVNIPKRYGLQYLRYSVENYENIKNGDFSNEIIRLVPSTISYNAVESQIVYKTYWIEVPVFPDLIDEIQSSIDNNFWDWNPEEVYEDNGDTDTVSRGYDHFEIDGDPYVLK